jgi:hypothetical protein
MLAQGYDTFGLPHWTTWLSLVAGALASSFVIGSAVMYGRWRRRLTGASREEDLPWADLLRLLEQRNRDRAAAGLPPEEATEEVLAELLASLPSAADPRRLVAAEVPEILSGGAERRSSRRRWGNPTEVHVHSPLWADHLHGLVVNRSTGGLAIFADKEVPPGTLLKVRAVEAPSSVPAIRAEVRHCRKVGKGFFFGCQFSEDVPWNTRVWFG